MILVSADKAEIGVELRAPMIILMHHALVLNIVDFGEMGFTNDPCSLER